MTKLGQPRHGLHRDAFFEREQTVPCTCLQAPARAIQHLLGTKIIIQHGGYHLKMALRLHKAPHDAEAGPELAVFQRHTGDYGVIGSLAARQRIWMVRVKAEVSATILQED